MTDIADRDERLAAGAEELAARGDGSIVSQRQFLLVASGALMTLGLTAIVLGWIGASRSTLVEEQVPYLISGGLLGVALSIIGALSFFSHWFVTGIREARVHEAARQRDHAELVAAISSLTDALTPKEETNGTARSPRSSRSVRRTPSR
ncbi:MAG TPA: hypothetical protein VHC63_16410 [Acidimicrobiales bacterium]|nr:hypothetical protein [Acidimicrobiales bacterium]